jgi:hypothetical protein
MNTLGMIAIVIDDYDSAISHYVNDLGFTLIEDTVLSPEKRWVVVAPSSQGARILLAPLVSILVFENHNLAISLLARSFNELNTFR